MLNNTTTSPILGLGGTKWLNTPSLYGGDDLFTRYYYSGANTVDDVDNWTTPAGGIWDDDPTHQPPLPLPGSNPQDAVIQEEAEYIHILYGLPDDTLVFVLLPPGLGRESPYSGECGAHGWVGSAYTWAWQSYPDSVSACTQNMTGWTLSHELQEAIVNPLNTSWRSTANCGSNGETEIVDICNAPYYLATPQANGTTAGIQSMQVYSTEAMNSNGCVYSRSTWGFLFGLDSTGTLWGSLMNPTSQLNDFGWVSWGKPGGAQLTNAPAATSSGSGGLDVFVPGADNVTMNHAYSTTEGYQVNWDTVTSPLPSGVTLERAPDAVSWGNGNAQVWAVGLDGAGTEHVMFNGYDWSSSGHHWWGWTLVTPPEYRQGIFWFSDPPNSKVTVASPQVANINTAPPALPQTPYFVNVAYFDAAGDLDFGYWQATYANGVPSGSITWSTIRYIPTYNGQHIYLHGDPDMASWAPGHVDITFKDTSGYVWDCYSTDHATIAGCVPLGQPSFASSPTIVGYGDGRFVSAGVTSGDQVLGLLYDWSLPSYANIGTFTSGLLAVDGTSW
jgi:hypothetical protein